MYMNEGVGLFIIHYFEMYIVFSVINISFITKKLTLKQLYFVIGQM